MGWKTLKEHFNIQHILQVSDGLICIGSGYVHDLLTIDPHTGEIVENKTFSNFLNREYPTLKAATKSDVLALLNSSDTFSKSLPVFTFHRGEVIEKQCEQYGYPHVTHDGELMHENTFTQNKTKAIAWAKRDSILALKYENERICELHRDLAKAEAMREKYELEIALLNQKYPIPENE